MTPKVIARTRRSSSQPTTGVDDLRLQIAEQLAALDATGQAVLRSHPDGEILAPDRILDYLELGGTFTIQLPALPVVTLVNHARRNLQYHARGALTLPELRHLLLEGMGQIRHFLIRERPFDSAHRTAHLKREVRRLERLIGPQDDLERFGEDYLARRYRKAVELCVMLFGVDSDQTVERRGHELIEAIVALLDRRRMTIWNRKQQLAWIDARDRIVHGRELILSAIPEDDARILDDLRGMLLRWRRGRITGSALAKQIKQHVGRLQSVDAQWWDRCYQILGDLWIVTLGRVATRTRADLDADSTVTRDLDGLVEQMAEQLDSVTTQFYSA